MVVADFLASPELTASAEGELQGTAQGHMPSLQSCTEPLAPLVSLPTGHALFYPRESRALGSCSGVQPEPSPLAGMIEMIIDGALAANELFLSFEVRSGALGYEVWHMGWM